jgi:hypothetical protein
MLPGHIDIPAAWFGSETAKRPDIWHCTLHDEEIHELISAASKFCASGVELWRINQQNFVLNKFAVRLSAIQAIFIYVASIEQNCMGLAVSRFIFCSEQVNAG